MVISVLLAGLSFSSLSSQLPLDSRTPQPQSANVRFAAGADGGGRITVHGTGSNSARMLSSADLAIPGKTYVLRFTSKCTSTEGLLPCGMAGVNRDFQPTLDESAYSLVFRVGDKPSHRKVSLGQYWLKGSVEYSKVSLQNIVPVHSTYGKRTLGDGEVISTGQYQDNHDFGWKGSTIHRTLDSFRCEFNSNRWVFQEGSEVVYKYNIGSSTHSAKLELNVNYYVSGSLTVSVSSDGSNYANVAEYSAKGAYSVNLPADKTANGKFWIKLSSNRADTSLQVDKYLLTAKTDYAGRTLTGRTALIEEPVHAKQLNVQWTCQGGLTIARAANQTNSRLALTILSLVNGQTVKAQNVELKPKAALALQMPEVRVQGKETQEVRLLSAGKCVYAASTENHVPPIEDNHCGYRLPAKLKGLDLWWCESNWKVGRGRNAPVEPSDKPLSISACRGETEAAQLVLAAGSSGAVLNKVDIEDLKCGNSLLPKSAFTVREVAYVPVGTPTDAWGSIGDYPDPLPALQPKLAIPSRKNQPIWISVKVPDGQAPGDYKGTIKIETNRGSASIAFAVTVYGFDMPKVPNLKSALGINTGWLGDYAKTQDRGKLKSIFDKWMQNFAEHRISPYSFYPYAPIKVSFVGPETRRRVEIDWTEFDQAAKAYLDRYKLCSFRLDLIGLGGGTFYNREIGTLDGKKAGTPEYEALMASYLQQVESHLRKNGWLDKAYIYWFDEPDAKDYPFVVEVNQRIKKYAPGLRRLLTEQPEKELIGNVEIWTGILNMWSKQTIDERNKAGDEVWWYICCGPKEPYVGEFIDHPGTEPRMWIWQTWQYGVHGILIWTTNWWTSAAAFPNNLQDPWTDPMSYVDGYGTPKGARYPWGNGDGRFLYPPRRDPNAAKTEDLSGPIDSIRWEALRDGMEDYEYFFLLDRLIKDKGSKADAKLIEEAQSLLQVPDAISKDLTNFTTDPRLMLAHRDKMARMIEKLAKL